MAQYIEKDKIEEILRHLWKQDDESGPEDRICYNKALQEVQCRLDAIEVKDVDLEAEERMKECPFRQVGCTMYEGKVLECRGACSWVVDYPKLKELKAKHKEEL